MVLNNIVCVCIDCDMGLLINKFDFSLMFEYFEAGIELIEYVSEYVNEFIYLISFGEELF